MSFPKNYPWYGYYKSSENLIIVRFDQLIRIEIRGSTIASATVLYIDPNPNVFFHFRKNNVINLYEDHFVPIKESEVNVIIRENKLSKII